MRSFGGVVLGYLTIVAVVTLGLFLMWTVLGGSGSFDGESQAPSFAWITGAIVSGFVAALAAGYVARKVGGSATAPKALIAVVLVLGLGLAAYGTFSDQSKPPLDKAVGEMSFFEAGQHAVNPDWYNWIIPFVGAAGVFLAGGLRESG